MIEDRLFLISLRYYISKFNDSNRIPELELEKIYKQVKIYYKSCKARQYYDLSRVDRKIKFNNSFKFTCCFRIKHNDFFKRLQNVETDSKKCFTLTRNTLSMNPIFSKTELQLIEFSDIYYENLIRYFIYRICSGVRSSFESFKFHYYAGVNLYLASKNEKFDEKIFELELKRGAIAYLSFILRLTGRLYNKNNLSNRHLYHIKEIYVKHFI